VGAAGGRGTRRCRCGVRICLRLGWKYGNDLEGYDTWSWVGRCKHSVGIIGSVQQPETLPCFHPTTFLVFAAT